MAMKFLILVTCLLGFTAASFYKRAQDVLDDAENSMREHAAKSGSLREVLGMPDAVELDEVEEDIKQSLIDTLVEKLKDLAIKAKDMIDNKKAGLEEVVAKIKDIKEKLHEIHYEVKGKLKELLVTIGKSLIGKLKEIWNRIFNKEERSLNDEYDILARSKFSELLEKVKSEILENETIRKIREYIRNFVTTNPVLQKIKEFLLKLREVDFKELIRSLLEGRNRETRGIKEAWEKVKDFFNGLGEHVSDKFGKLKNYLKDIWDDYANKMREKHGMIKAIALELLAHMKDVSAEVFREAIELMRPHKEDLGVLWKELIDAGKKVIGHE